MTHPDYIVPLAELATLQKVEPVYRMTAGLTPKVLGKAIREALARAPELPEWQDAAYLKRQGWPAWHAALLAVHQPESERDLALDTRARQRLAFDELRQPGSRQRPVLTDPEGRGFRARMSAPEA